MAPHIRSCIAIAIAVVAATGKLSAQRPAADTLPRPTMRALRIQEPIHIDGALTEAAWAGAQPASDFIQERPSTGAPATQRSEARILIDNFNLYVGFRMYDTSPDSIGLQLARRDVGDTHTDWVWIGIDSYGDRRTGFAFAVSPRGGQRDAYLSNDSDLDISWDAVWESAARVDSLGWTAELRIPLSQLRFAAGDSTRTWGVQFLRQTARSGEQAWWSPRLPTSPSNVSRFGTLTGLGALERGLPIEAIPYVRSQVGTVPPDPGNPFHRSFTPEAAIGLDVRMRLPKSLTLTATVNPDFGQVEADPAAVNLSAFELFFAERRPFFLENFDTFGFGRTTTFTAGQRSNFLYTRRIGRAPQRRPSGSYSDVPGQTPILAAVKLSGTTPGGWAIGSMNATTGRATGRVALEDETIRREPVEPLTNAHVTRVRRLMRGGYTSVGAFGSWLERSLADTVLQPLLTDRALVGGVDVEHAWMDRRWSVSGVVAQSQVSGDARAVTRLQRASYRSFHRPDASHLTFDSTRTSLGGGYYALSIAKTAGRLIGSVTAEQLDPGFESNDLGFQTSSDFRALSTAVTYRQLTQTPWFQTWSTGWFGSLAATTAGENLERRIATFNRVQFRNFWAAVLEGSVETGRFNDRLLRGGPLAARPTSLRLEMSVESDTRRRFIVGVGAETVVDRAGRRVRSYAVETDWRPFPAVRLRVEPEIAFNDVVDQFVTARDDAFATETFGRRYVFADVRQREARLNTRLDWTFSPRLSLQIFAQPYASAADFLRFKEFLAPREFDFAVYGTDRGTVARDTVARDTSTVTIDPDGAGPASSLEFGEPNFTARQLRGNAVLRWEIRPGSALFVVWQQTRDSYVNGTAELDAPRQLGALLGAPPRNVFLVKLAWWLGR